MWALPKLSAINETTTKDLAMALPLFDDSAFTVQALSNIALGFAKAPHLSDEERKHALENVSESTVDTAIFTDADCLFTWVGRYALGNPFSQFQRARYLQPLLGSCSCSRRSSDPLPASFGENDVTKNVLP